MNNINDPRETYNFPIPLWKPSGMRIAGGQGLMQSGRFIAMCVHMLPWGLWTSSRHSAT